MDAPTQFRLSCRRLSSSTAFLCVFLSLLFTNAVVYAQVRDTEMSGSEGHLAQQTMRLESDEVDSETAVDSETSMKDTTDASSESDSDLKNADKESIESASDELDAEQSAEDQQRNDVAVAHLVKLRKSITEIRISAGSNVALGERPANRSAELFASESPRLVSSVNSVPQPPTRYPVPFCHRPLYFQQPDLERCGRVYRCGSSSCGYMQNAVSGLTFLVNTMVLPYRIATERPDCPVPHQGDCRACQSTGGDCEPLQAGRDGLLTEAAAIAGFTFLLL